MISIMNGGEFIRRVRKLGKLTGTPVHFESRPGKGSHGRLYYGSKFTTVKDRKKEIRAGLLHAMLYQLGLTIEDVS